MVDRDEYVAGGFLDSFGSLRWKALGDHGFDVGLALL